MKMFFSLKEDFLKRKKQGLLETMKKVQLINVLFHLKLVLLQDLKEKVSLILHLLQRGKLKMFLIFFMRKENKEKYLRSDKSPIEREYEDNLEECTFKPDLKE